jgi:flagellar biosynthesis/type III secretory pathway protein FliH
VRNIRRPARISTILTGKAAQDLSSAQFEKFGVRPVNYFRGIAPTSQGSSYLNDEEVAQHVEQQLEVQRQASFQERQGAHQQGFDEGLAKGRKEGHQQIQPAIDLLQDWNRMVRAEKEELARRYEGEVLELGFLIARKILGEELVMRPQAVVGVVRQALRKILNADSVTLRVHPDDLKLLEDARERLSAEASSGIPIEFKADSAITRGGCLIETESGLLDARLDSQLERLRTLLAGNDWERISSEPVALDNAQ